MIESSHHGLSLARSVSLHFSPVRSNLCKHYLVESTMPPRVIALNIKLPEGATLPNRSPLLVELRDTSLADAPAVPIKQVRSSVARGRVKPLRVTIDPGSIPDGTTVWVHLDVDRDGRVSPGDYITVQSYPAAVHGPQEMTIQLKRV